MASGARRDTRRAGATGTPAAPVAASAPSAPGPGRPRLLSPVRGALPEPILHRGAVVLWAIATVLGVCGCLLPHGSGVFLPGWWALTGGAAAMAVVSWCYRGAMPAVAEYAMSLAACAAVTLAMLSAHHSEAIFPTASLYVLATVFTASFYEPVTLAAYLVLQSAASGAVMLTSGQRPALAGWVVMMGTAATAGVCVHLLTRALGAAAEADPLTGLPNRRAMERVLVRELARAQRSQEPLAVAVLDLDGFKDVNDRHGHAAGDRALVEVATSWTQHLRTGDVLGRLGGDEFVLLLPGTSAHEAARVVERCQAEGTHPCSAGVAQADGTIDLQELLRQADDACYRSKRSQHRVVLVEAAAVPAGGD